MRFPIEPTRSYPIRDAASVLHLFCLGRRPRRSLRGSLLLLDLLVRPRLVEVNLGMINIILVVPLKSSHSLCLERRTALGVVVLVQGENAQDDNDQDRNSDVNPQRPLPPEETAHSRSFGVLRGGVVDVSGVECLFEGDFFGDFFDNHLLGDFFDGIRVHRG